MSDILSSASLLLAILTTVFSLVYPSLKEVLDIKPAKHKPDNDTYYKKAKLIRKTKLLPLLLGSVLLTLVFIPELLKQVGSSINIVKKNGFSGSTYDTVIASFIVVILFMFILTVIIVVLAFEFQNKIKALDPKE